MHQPQHSHGDPATRPHRHGGAFDSARAAALLDVEGELSAGLVDDAITVCAGLLDDAGVNVRRVIDLGCGPGVGTTSLAAAFRSATIVSVDGSPAMLKRTRTRATRLGHADRVVTRQLDLDEDLQTLGLCDLAWAAMAVHHADDEVATLRRIRSLLDARSLLCVLERANPTSIRCADDLGRPGIWERLERSQSEWFESVRGAMPGAENAEAYPSMLAAAGLEALVDRTLTGTVEAPRDAATYQFIAGQLQGMVRNLAAFALRSDLEAVSELLQAKPDITEGRWAGVTITSSRKLLVAKPTTD